MAPTPTPDDIERQLGAMRTALARDVRDFTSDARRLVDWRYHFRSHAWLFCGGAVAVGFMLVPRRQRPTRTDGAAVNGTMGDERFVSPPRVAKYAEGSFWHAMFRLAATAVARESVGYLIKRARRDDSSISQGTNSESRR